MSAPSPSAAHSSPRHKATGVRRLNRLTIANPDHESSEDEDQQQQQAPPPAPATSSPRPPPPLPPRVPVGSSASSNHHDLPHRSHSSPINKHEGGGGPPPGWTPLVPRRGETLQANYDGGGHQPYSAGPDSASPSYSEVSLARGIPAGPEYTTAPTRSSTQLPPASSTGVGYSHPPPHSSSSAASSSSDFSPIVTSPSFAGSMPYSQAPPPPPSGQQQLNSKGSRPPTPPPKSPYPYSRSSAPAHVGLGLSSSRRGRGGGGGEELSTSATVNESTPRPNDGHSRTGSIERTVGQARRSPAGKVMLLVTLDGSKYASVDIDGDDTASAIREKTLSALEIRDDDQSSFSLFRHQMRAGASVTPSMIPLSGGSLVDFCAEPGDIKSILALQTSLDASSLPLVPPPSTTTAPSRTTRRSLERDAAAGVGGTAYRQPSETASSISDQVIGENEYFGTVHRGPASETSMSEDATATTTGEVGSTVGGGGGGGGGGTGVRPSIVRKPHTRRMSGVGIGGHCAPSPGTGSRRGTRTSSSSNNSNSGAGNTGAPQSARSPEISSPPAIVGIPEASSDSSSPPLRASRIGNVMPTFLPQATAFSLNSPPPEWSESPPSTSPRQSLSSSDAPAAARSALRHLTSAEEEEEKEEMERAFLQSEREQWLASEDAENERKAREAALEWERKDREEEEERKRRQIEADHEAAMREQRREQDLWVMSQQQESARRAEEQSLRLQIQQQEARLAELQQQQQQQRAAQAAAVAASRSESSSSRMAVDEFGGVANRSGGAGGGGGPNARTLSVGRGGSTSFPGSSAASLGGRPQERLSLYPIGTHEATARQQGSDPGRSAQSPQVPSMYPRQNSSDQMRRYLDSVPLYHQVVSPPTNTSSSQQQTFTRPLGMERPPGASLGITNQRGLHQMRSNPNIGSAAQQQQQSSARSAGTQPWSAGSGGGPNQSVPTPFGSMGRVALGPNGAARLAPAYDSQLHPSGVPSQTSSQPTTPFFQGSPFNGPSPLFVASSPNPRPRSPGPGFAAPARQWDDPPRDPPPRQYDPRALSPTRPLVALPEPQAFPSGPNPHFRRAIERSSSPQPRRPSTVYDDQQRPIPPQIARRPSSHHDSPLTSPALNASPPRHQISPIPPQTPFRAPSDWQSYLLDPPAHPGLTHHASMEPDVPGPSGHRRFQTEPSGSTDLGRHMAGGRGVVAIGGVAGGPPLLPPPPPAFIHSASTPISSTSPLADDDDPYGGIVDVHVPHASAVDTRSHVQELLTPSPNLALPMFQPSSPASDVEPTRLSTPIVEQQHQRLKGPIEGHSDSSDESSEDDDDLFISQKPKATTNLPSTPRPPCFKSGTVETLKPDDRDGSSTLGPGGDSTIKNSAELAGIFAEGLHLDASDGGTIMTKPIRLDNRSLPPIQTTSDQHATQQNAEHSGDLPSSRPGSGEYDGPATSASADPDEEAFDEQQVSANATGGPSTGLLRRKKTVFAQNLEKPKQWSFRPPPEVVVKDLSKFFPKVNLEAEVVEAVSTNVVGSGTGDQPQLPLPTSPTADRERRLRNRKSIRRVAEDRQRILERPPAPSPVLAKQQAAPASATVSVVRRRSTRMWGSRVEEVKPAELSKTHIPVLQEIDGEASSTQPETFKWVKGDLIGKGAYGRVYLGLNATTGEMLAVKQVEMPKTDSDKADSRQTLTISALKSEIQLLKDLDHPNVVQYLGCEESEDFISIFLEYVPGGSLGSVFRKYGKLQEGEVRHFSRQILSGLAYLHSRNILHRDLKGDNILVDPHLDGVCKITDFGISKHTSDAYDNADGTLMQGSMYWMAPEVVNNQGRGYSAKVDIWSFGCVVLEMASGERPWQGLEMMAIMFRLGTGHAPPIPDGLGLSPAALDFLEHKALAINVADRPSAAEALEHEFLQADLGWSWKRDSELAQKVNMGAATGGERRRRRGADE